MEILSREATRDSKSVFIFFGLLTILGFNSELNKIVTLIMRKQK